MFDPADRQFLQRWCRARRMKWLASTSTDGSPAILLFADAADRPPMRLVAGREGLRLETEGADILAAASTLPALLDVLDAGIADLPAPPPRPGPAPLSRVA